MNPEQWLADFNAQVAEIGRKAAEARDNIAAASATAASPDGAVAVTVGPSGGLQDLRLGHRACELGPARLTALILETARRAQLEATAKVRTAFEPLGADTETMNMIMDTIPDAVPSTSPARPASRPDDDYDNPW